MWKIHKNPIRLRRNQMKTNRKLKRLPSEELEASVSGPPSQLPNEANPLRQGSVPSTNGPFVVKLQRETRSIGELFDVVEFRLTLSGKLQSIGSASSPIHWRPLYGEKKKRKKKRHTMTTNYDIMHSTRLNKILNSWLTLFLAAAEGTLSDEESTRNAAVRNINKLAIILSSLIILSPSSWICWDRCASLDTPSATEHVQTGVVGFLNLSSMVTTWIITGQTKKHVRLPNI